MQYFKHHSNMRHNVKIKRTIAKYGLEGYGLYNLMLESITESLSTGSPIPDLKETCEDIAEFYNGNTAKIQEMTHYMVNQGLFDIDDISGVILCHKLYKFLDTSQTRSEELRTMIKSYKTTTYIESDSVSDKYDRIEENKNRIEEEKNKSINDTFKQFYNHYGNKQQRPRALSAYKKATKNKSFPNQKELFDIIDKWRDTDKWKCGYQPYPSSWLNSEGWLDELPTVKPSSTIRQDFIPI